MALIYLASEVKTIDVDQKCSNQSIKLTWLNSLGAWEYWTFTAKKTYSFNTSNVQTIKRDIFEDWDSDFITGQTESEHLSLSANQSIAVRSQNLTSDQAEAIARIKQSIKVQDFTDPENPLTVLVDKGSISYTTDRAKTNFIEFSISYPDIIIQSL